MISRRTFLQSTALVPLVTLPAVTSKTHEYGWNNVCVKCGVTKEAVFDGWWPKECGKPYRYTFEWTGERAVWRSTDHDDWSWIKDLPRPTSHA